MSHSHSDHQTEQTASKRYAQRTQIFMFTSFWAARSKIGSPLAINMEIIREWRWHTTEHYYV